jgi:thiol-disulfide isomerase/thioredoxin
LKYFFSLVIIVFLSCASKEEKKIRHAEVKNIGEQFLIDNVADSSGNKITLDFSASNITIIDFWNNGCPPCIEEMKQFPALIKGKAARVSILSISLTQYWLWKPTLQEHKGTFAFLEYDVPNWKQYNLLTTDNPRFKNPISNDRLGELSSRYGINFNPAYIVVDRSGKILARPESAVEYLRELGL